MLRALLFVLTLHSFALAQNTWRGLHFGMSEEEVRKGYEGSLDKMSEQEIRDFFKDAAKNTDVLEDAGQKLEGLPARAKLVFDKDRKTLIRITVSVKDPFEDGADGPETTGHSLRAIDMLNNDLAEKYGKSITEDGECNLTVGMVVHSPGKPFSCEKMWKSEGQNIRMNWWFFYGRLSAVFLTYTPLPKDI